MIDLYQINDEEDIDYYFDPSDRELKNLKGDFEIFGKRLFNTEIWVHRKIDGMGMRVAIKELRLSKDKSEFEKYLLKLFK